MFAVPVLQEIKFDQPDRIGFLRIVDCIHFSVCGWHPRLGRLPEAGSQDDRGIPQLCGPVEPKIDPYGDDCPILAAETNHPDCDDGAPCVHNLQFAVFTFHKFNSSQY